MVVNYTYSAAVWDMAERWSGFHNLTNQSPAVKVKQWWAEKLGPEGHNNFTERLQVISHVIWNLWKERCRRIFCHRMLTVQQLSLLIQQDVHTVRMAR
uniref:Uncharacterized protein n=1 Tax=Arundo donax TaxID=35708 RepID=A0A0A9FT36_ARUDO